MKKLPLLFILIITIVGTTGCISKSIDQEQRPVVQLMKKVPNGSDYFVFMDFKEMQSELFLNMVSRNDIAAFEEMLELMGVDIREIEYIIIAFGYTNGPVVVMRGSYDFTDLKTVFDDTMGDSYKYYGVDIWKDSNESTALLSNHIIGGDTTVVEECIDIIRNGRDSLYDDVIFKNIVDRLPDGPYVQCANKSFWEGLEITEYPESMGTTFQFIDMNKIEYTIAAKFEDKDAATIKMNEFSNDRISKAQFETLLINLTTEGQYGYATFEIDTEHPLEPSSERTAKASETELKNITLALTALMADSGASELDADYTEVDTYEEVKNITANDSGYSLAAYLDIKAGESLFQAYDISKDGTVDISSERFTEFYILGPDGKAEDYPSELTVGEKAIVTLGIVNREYAEVTYDIEITIDGEPVGQIASITLSAEEEWEDKVSFGPANAGAEQQVKFLLYKNGEYYLDVHLWIDVSE